MSDLKVNSFLRDKGYTFTLQDIPTNLQDKVITACDTNLKEIDETVRFLFYSNLIECNPTEEEVIAFFKDNEDCDKELLSRSFIFEERDYFYDDLLKLAYKYSDPLSMKFLKHGDIIRFFGEDYRDQGSMIYGAEIGGSSRLQSLDIHDNGYPCVPSNFKINDLPLVDYFEYSMDCNRDICMRIDFKKLEEIVKDIKYRTDDGILIYLSIQDLQKFEKEYNDKGTIRVSPYPSKTIRGSKVVFT